MNRTFSIVTLIVAAATASAITAAVFIARTDDRPVMSDEQRETRERFFGSNGELPSIHKGQEMRPRW